MNATLRLAQVLFHFSIRLDRPKRGRRCHSLALPSSALAGQLFAADD
jgi:hypothetical protein